MNCPNCGQADSVMSQTYVEDVTKHFTFFSVTHNVYYFCKDCGYMFRNANKNEISQTTLHLK